MEYSMWIAVDWREAQEHSEGGVSPRVRGFNTLEAALEYHKANKKAGGIYKLEAVASVTPAVSIQRAREHHA
jgi:hypothetical protein